MVLLTGLILLAQLFAYLQRRQQLTTYAELFPEVSTLGILHYRILRSALDRNATDALLTGMPKFHLPEGAEAGVLNLQGTSERIVPVQLLAVSKPSKAFTPLAYALNAYLLRNSATSIDYTTLEGIAERSNHSQQAQVQPLLSGPLRIGLLGTVAMIALFFFLRNTAIESPTLVPDGLWSIAHYLLVPLLTGLVLQLLLRNQFYQKAQVQNTQRRQAFYTFLQTDLLPYLNPLPEGTLRSLQNQLQRFGQDFSSNLNRLDGLLVRNYDALLAQTQLLDSIRNSDLVAITGANVTVLQELQQSTGLLSGFNSYLTQVEGLLQMLQQGVGTLNTFLARTETVEDLAGRALAATHENRQLLAFLQSHYQELDKSRQLLADGVVDVNRTLQGALEELQRFTQEKIDRIRAIETYESERLSVSNLTEEHRLLREAVQDLRQVLSQRP
ncbi:MAG: hypothetical protein EOP52_05215 [Sphingobacteriales bacterium]|nr:MAG: hypothetical protein EOP52_05215 [Sphingobacteriales bacterium]